MDVSIDGSVHRSVRESTHQSHNSARDGRTARWRRLLLAVPCAFALALPPATALAGSAKEISKQAGLGAGSALITLVYAPVKLTYALGGLLVGGLAYGFSGGDQEVAQVVFTPSILGDYVVTPAQVSGRERLEFFGRDPDYAVREVDVAAAPKPEPEPESYGW